MKISLISTSTYPGDQGLRTISSFLKKNNHEVKMIFLIYPEDYNLIYPKKVLNQLAELCKNSDLIGISSMASTSIRATQIIRYLKSLQKPIVWGGIHATISPGSCIKEADIVCIGEGEETILELANKIKKDKDFSKIKNLWVKKNGSVVKNPVRKLVEDLDKFPFPDYDIEDHFILEKDRIIKFKERHFGGQVFFQTERGCPNACTYCINKKLKNIYKNKGKVIRTHSIDYMIEELKILKNKFPSVKVFDLRDEVFFVRPYENIKDLCDKYKKHIGVRMKCLADPPTVDEKKLKLMVDAGLTDIIIGIQGSERVNFQIYKRYIKDEQVLKAAKIINKFKEKLAVMYDVITTNPYESKEDILDLIKLLRKLPKPYYLSVNNLVFFIGSELYDKAKKESLIKTKKDSAFDLNYWDRWQHIKLKKKNAYLNLVLNLMRGVATKQRFGIMPNFLLNFLLNKNIVEFNLRYTAPTYMAGSIVQVADFFREKVAKPVYRSMPTGFKSWYDKVRYRI